MVKSYVIPWQPRARTGSLQLMCQFGKQGRLLSAAMPSPCHPPCSLPYLATVQLCSRGCQEWRGTLPWMTLLPHSAWCYVSPTSNYHHPVHQKHSQSHHWIHSLHLLQIRNTQQNQMPTILIYTQEECHLEVVLHSPFTTNGKSKCQPTNNFSRGFTLVPKLS